MCQGLHAAREIDLTQVLMAQALAKEKSPS